jgi:hypothetical protein
MEYVIMIFENEMFFDLELILPTLHGKYDVSSRSFIP